MRASCSASSSAARTRARTSSDFCNPSARAAYACDVTYGTNNEYGFDYL
ncbi:MAG: hypothetical protein ACK5PI_09410, partial [Acetobacteraceae bacterium]